MYPPSQAEIARAFTIPPWDLWSLGDWWWRNVYLEGLRAMAGAPVYTGPWPVPGGAARTGG